MSLPDRLNVTAQDVDSAFRTSENRMTIRDGLMIVLFVLTVLVAVLARA